jgi:hypothetical protein
MSNSQVIVGGFRSSPPACGGTDRAKVAAGLFFSIRGGRGAFASRPCSPEAVRAAKSPDFWLFRVADGCSRE